VNLQRKIGNKDFYRLISACAMCELSHYGNCDPETEEEEYCIFHRPNKNEKEAKEFWRKFFDRFKPEEEEIEIEGFKRRRFIFKEDINCSGYVFPTFFGETGTVIRARPFYYSIFRGEAYFLDAVFSGEAEFSHAVFSGEAVFFNAKFEEESDFSYAVFSGEAEFSHAKFEGVNFSHAKFEEESDFSYAVFSGGADFFNAKFEKKANFFSAVFSGGAYFSEAIFSGEADFSEAIFSRRAEFSRAKFEGVNFFNAKFEEKADFSEAIFSRRAEFSRAKFSGESVFIEATFSGNVDFSGANFEEKSDFSEGKFEKSVSFPNARFYKFLDFSRTKFPTLKEEDAEDLLSYASFRCVYFEHPEWIVFDGIEGKAKISFINTDISRVVFRNCSFDFLYDEFLLKNRKKLEEELKDVEERINSIEKLKEGKYARKKFELLEDRRKLKYELNYLTLDNVLSVIRMLRENFDYCMKYEESGRLFIKEMDLKRDYLLKGGAEKRRFTDKISRYVEWFTYSLYRIMSLYGESIARPIFWIFGTIILFGVLRGLLSSPLFNGVHLSSLMRGIQESLEAFVQLRWDGSFLTLIERVISALNLGVLYISLHRKLERRIRH
jgi:uncharacterized protein YjbI with pentapeptide repeats